MDGRGEATREGCEEEATDSPFVAVTFRTVGASLRFFAAGAAFTLTAGGGASRILIFASVRCFSAASVRSRTLEDVFASSLRSTKCAFAVTFA